MFQGLQHRLQEAPTRVGEKGEQWVVDAGGGEQKGVEQEGGEKQEAEGVADAGVVLDGVQEEKIAGKGSNSSINNSSNSESGQGLAESAGADSEATLGEVWQGFGRCL